MSLLNNCRHIDPNVANIVGILSILKGIQLVLAWNVSKLFFFSCAVFDVTDAFVSATVSMSQSTMLIIWYLGFWRYHTPLLDPTLSPSLCFYMHHAATLWLTDELPVNARHDDFGPIAKFERLLAHRSDSWPILWHHKASRRDLVTHDLVCSQVMEQREAQRQEGRRGGPEWEEGVCFAECWQIGWASPSRGLFAHVCASSPLARSFSFLSFRSSRVPGPRPAAAPRRRGREVAGIHLVHRCACRSSLGVMCKQLGLVCFFAWLGVVFIPVTSQLAGRKEKSLYTKTQYTIHKCIYVPAKIIFSN